MRKHILLLSIIFSLPLAGFSQYYYDYGMKLGASNYLGDIGGLDRSRRNFVADMKLQETRWAVGGYLRYKVRDPWSAELQLNWVRVSGADSLTTKYDPRRGRNLNFRNDIIQLNLLGEWTFFENPDLGNTYRYENSFSAYLAVGFSVFYQDPHAYGNPPGGHGWGWYNLHPLETEGVHYHLIQPGIPVAAGFNFTLSKMYRIGWSITWTKTFTDYLDDISTKYVDPSKLSSPEAIYFANRTTPEAAGNINVDNYGPGSQRGDSKNKDNFITTTIDFGYVIRGRSNVYRKHYGGLFSKNKFKVRRRRAKF